MSPSSWPSNFDSGIGNKLVPSLVTTELLKSSYLIPQPVSIPVLLDSQHCPPVVQTYLEHSAYFVHTHRYSYCLFLYVVLMCAQS